MHITVILAKLLRMSS